MTYFFFIESPEATTGNAITVYANPQDQYPDGAAYRNGAVVHGDLAFTAYSRATFTLTSVLDGLISPVGQDVPFFLLYGILIFGICASLVFFLCESPLS